MPRRNTNPDEMIAETIFNFIFQENLLQECSFLGEKKPGIFLFSCDEDVNISKK
jgi:hypothetical protein